MKTKKDLKKFTWRDIVFLISYFVVQFLFIFIAMFIYMAIAIGNGTLDPASASPDMLSAQMGPLIIWSTVISGITMAILAVCLYWRLLKEQAQDFWKNWKQYILIIIIGYVVSLGIEMIFSYLIDIETSANQIAIEEMFAGATTLQMIGLQISVVFTAPLVEEFLCRKVMFGSYKHLKIVGPIMFVVSSVAFGLLHYGFDGQFITLIPYIIMGAVLAAAYWKTDNILVPIGIHFVNNAIASILIIIFSMI